MNSTSDLQAIISRPPKWCHVACQPSPEPPTDHRSMMVNGDGQRWSTTQTTVQQWSMAAVNDGQRWRTTVD
ncbi:hypothetical protein Tco_0800236, partial [Tanacetum coccineum]